MTCQRIPVFPQGSQSFVGDKNIQFEIPGTLQIVQNYTTWLRDKKAQHIPLLQVNDLDNKDLSSVANWVYLNLEDYSLEVIQKIITRFPELGYKWYLDNEDLPINMLTNIVIERRTPEVSKEEKQIENDKGKSQTTPNSTSSLNIHSESNDKRVQKILVFYSDNTFVEFVPKA